MSYSFTYAPLPFSHFKSALPQNATTSELNTFLSDYFRVILPSWVVPNLIAVTVLMGGLTVAASVVIVRKLRTKTFWFFRLQETSSGNLIVVSPTSSFVLIEGLYAIGLLIMSWAFVARSRGSIASTNFGFSSLILGIPLLAGSWNGMWGLFLSCPLGIKGGEGPSKLRAPLLNLCLFAIPFIFCAITVIFTCLQGFAQRRASQEFHKFEKELKSQDPNSMPTIDQINQAAKIFQDGAYAWHRMSQGYTYFFTFAVLTTISLTSVGIYLRKILQHHLRYNAELLANDGNAIEAKIWSNSVQSRTFPRVKMPDDAASTPLQGRTRRLVLHSALKLVQSLSASIAISALFFSAVTGYFAFALYPKAVQGPEEIGHIIGVLVVFFGWVTVAAGFPCWWLITSDLFEPALLGWQSRRAAGNVVIKSPAFNDSISAFKDTSRKQGSESEGPDAGEAMSTEEYRLSEARARNLSIGSGKDASLFSNSEGLEDRMHDIADVRVDRRFEENPFNPTPRKQKRNTIIVDSEGEEEEMDSRARGSWRRNN